jgi:hypothetical protein
VRKHLRYAAYVLRHKWYVFLYGWQLGIPWLALLHDNSKFRPDEWGPYAQFFYGRKAQSWGSPRDKTGYYKSTDTGDAAFDFAWLLHQKRNKHHWQWWIFPEDEGGLKVLPMPDRYRREMLADWRGAGMAQGKPDTLGWYRANQHKMNLHPDTRQWVEDQLGYVREPVSINVEAFVRP